MKKLKTLHLRNVASLNEKCLGLIRLKYQEVVLLGGVAVVVEIWQMLDRVKEYLQVEN